MEASAGSASELIQRAQGPFFLSLFFIYYFHHQGTSQLNEQLTRNVFLIRPTDDSPQVTSLTWAGDGAYIAVGNERGEIEVWDAETQTKLRTMAGHAVRTGLHSIVPITVIALARLMTNGFSHMLRCSPECLSCPGMVIFYRRAAETGRSITMMSELLGTKLGSSTLR